MQCGWYLRTASPVRTGSPDSTITHIASLPSKVVIHLTPNHPLPLLSKEGRNHPLPLLSKEGLGVVEFKNHKSKYHGRDDKFLDHNRSTNLVPNNDSNWFEKPANEVAHSDNDIHS